MYKKNSAYLLSILFTCLGEHKALEYIFINSKPLIFLVMESFPMLVDFFEVGILL